MKNLKKNSLDIIIPVFNEKDNILPVLDSLKNKVKTPFRILICYDDEKDNTLPVIKNYQGVDITLVKNTALGAHGAITTGFKESSAPAVIVFPADDFYNAGIIDKMYDKFSLNYCEIVAASRFMKGGRMDGCPLLKSFLVRTASFTLYWFASIPIKDASNGFRLFSRKALDTIKIESTIGFTYSLELLVKCKRLNYKIGEVPSIWIERTNGTSNFKILKWLPSYLRWYLYGFATTYLRLGPKTVKRNV